METVKGYVVTIVVLVIFALGLVPYFLGATQLRAGLYYGSLFFAVLLGVSILLLLHVPLRSSTDKEQTNYRVVHFTLRVALTLGIGAVIVAVLLVAALLWLRF